MKIAAFLLLLFFSFHSARAQDTHMESGEHQHDTISQTTHEEDTHSDLAEAEGTNTSEKNEDVKAAFSDFPNLHPLVVHFPVVLLLLAVFLQLLQIFVLKRNMDWVILLCAGGGFIGGYLAGVIFHPHTHELTAIAKEVLEHHEQYAQWTIYSSALAAVLKLISLFFYKGKRIFEVVVFLVLAFSAYSVSQAGHYGSQLVYIEGVGPQGDYLKPEAEEHAH